MVKRPKMFLSFIAGENTNMMMSWHLVMMRSLWEYLRPVLLFMFLKTFSILSVFNKIFKNDSSLGDASVSDLRLKLFIEEKVKR